MIWKKIHLTWRLGATPLIPLMESFKKLLKESLKKILFFIRFIFYFSLIITCKKNRHDKKKPRLREQNESFFFNFQMSVFLSFF